MLPLAQITQLPDNRKDSMADDWSSKRFQKALVSTNIIVRTEEGLHQAEQEAVSAATLI